MRKGLCPLLAATLAMPIAPAHAASCDFSGVVARVAQLMSDARLADAGIVLGTPRGILLKRYLGTGAYDDSTAIPLASASKLLAGVRIMQLVEQGRIDLDAPVSTYLPHFVGTKGTMTMRQMFSHTSGYGDDLASPVLSWTDVTLAQDVDYIACCVAQPFAPPGAYFAYGGISMQVGGEVAEVRSGEDWEAGWRAHVGAPLGAATIDWQGLGPTANYRISGGARASLPDYAKVLAMLVNGGTGNGRKVLGAGAIRTLATVQTAGAQLGYAPAGADGSTAYGIGAWIEDFSVSADAPTISSIGAFGYTPWVDFGAGYFGALMIEDHGLSATPISERAHDALRDISALVRAALDGSCALEETFDAVFVDDFDERG